MKNAIATSSSQDQESIGVPMFSSIITETVFSLMLYDSNVTLLLFRRGEGKTYT